MSISTREATVTLSGVTTLTFDRRYPYFAVRNDSSAPVYISTVNADCTAGADGVVAVPKDGSVVIANCGDILGEIFCFDERKVREKDASGNRQMSLL